VAQAIMRNYPANMASLHISAVVRPLREETVEQSRPLLRTLFMAVAVVLLIACVNLAGLMLVRAIRRQREFAVRLALGARATALLRQAILESLVLSAAGGMLGLARFALRIGSSLCRSAHQCEWQLERRRPQRYRGGRPRAFALRTGGGGDCDRPSAVDRLWSAAAQL
jgi:predicted lysophospholipase L1 biosynthesis ABC-type transport system permease subunit